MEQPIIKITNLSKNYTISRRQPYEYETLRDTVTELAKKPFRLLRRGTKLKKEKFWALQDINLSIYKGDKIGIIGRNGAGKSTLLKLLSQITYPTTGEIRLICRVASLLEVGTGFHPELTGRENIFLNGAILGMKQKEIRENFDDIVAFAGIDQFLDTPVKRYSSGMYVRLAFAIAAHLKSEILIVDEVLSVGDAEFQKKCLGKMNDIANSGRTVLFVSHNLGAIKQLCDKSILLADGKIVSQGDTQEVIRDYLSNQGEHTIVYTQKHNENKKVNLRKIQLNPHQENPTSNVNYDEDIIIRIEYEVNQPISNCLILLYLQTNDGNIAFASADYDMHPELREKREVGQYRTELKIPKKWLNTGTYNVNISINTNPVTEKFDRIDVIRFDIIDNGTTPKSLFHESARGGTFQPFLDWKTTRLPN